MIRRLVAALRMLRVRLRGPAAGFGDFGLDPRRYLLPSERPLAVIGIHPVVLASWATGAAVTSALVAAAAGASAGTTAAAGVGVGTLGCLLAYLTWCWLAASLVVTERRLVVVRVGRRITVDSVTHPATNDLRLRPSRLGRRLGYADVVVYFTSGEVAVRVRRVWRPEEVAEAARMIWFGDIPSPPAVRNG